MNSKRQHVSTGSPFEPGAPSVFVIASKWVPKDGPPGGVWQRLTPQQLSDHVKRSDIVSKWLQYRIGWRRLLQMCVGEEPAWASYEHSEMHAV